MRLGLPVLLLAVTLLGCSSEPSQKPAPPPAPDPVPPTSFVPTAKGRGGAAATVDQRATWAAIQMLDAGGNAVDAAVAAAAMLGVTDPFSCGVGGGGFMLVWLADEEQAIVVDHREVAPRAMDRAAFYENGMPIAFDALVTSGLSPGVPGTVRGWDEALRRYGTKKLGDAFELAIFVAEKGFDVDQTFLDQTTRNVERFGQITSTRALFLGADGKPYPIGAIWRNPDLAATYRAIGEGGAEAFYGGDIAHDIVATIKKPPFAADAKIVARPGLMDLIDLATYEARIRPAITSKYRGYTILGAGPPTSGGSTVAEALNILEGFEPSKLAKGDALHLYLEASRFAFADRNTFIGDPEFVTVPLAGLLSPAYAAERRKLIDPTKASTAAVTPGDPTAFQMDPSGKKDPPAGAFMGETAADARDLETTHIVVSDHFGNIVSYTCTIESEGGNGMVVPGRGFLLNNELTDFNMPADVATPHPNVLEPGKRPRSSMSPALVLKDGVPVLALGSPGGATIITTVTQIVFNHLDLGMPIDEALAAPRVSQRNAADSTSNAEPAFIGTPEAMYLQGLGHKFADAGAIGAATALFFAEDGTITAVAEPVRRNGGSAMVVEAAP